MKLSTILITLISLFLNSNTGLSRPSSQGIPNGIIVENISSALPYETYEQWIQHLKKEITFEEREFRKQFPPENFEEYKDKIQCPFDTYEEWVQTLRRRWQRRSTSKSRLAEEERQFRRKYPHEEFERFRKEIDYAKFKYMSDGFKVACFVLTPRDAAGKKLPVIIYNRGGHHEVAAIDLMKLLSFRTLVSEGYVLVAGQYRGGPDSEGNDEIGGADVNDVLNLIPLIESLPYTDASRIGMFGWSRGGMMTYIALTKTDRISAAIIGAGPADITTVGQKRSSMEEEVLSRFVSDYARNREEILKSRSAIYWPEKLHTRQ
ncbi:alpha/beta hydrolase family protein [Planctomycetota bacterium]